MLITEEIIDSLAPCYNDWKEEFPVDGIDTDKPGYIDQILKLASPADVACIIRRGIRVFFHKQQATVYTWYSYTEADYVTRCRKLLEYIFEGKELPIERWRK